jgi:hypothetical protein
MNASSRRQMLQLAAGAATFAFGLAPARTAETRIGALIDKARPATFVGERIGIVSQALIGSRYVEYPLIGGPRKAEQFVLRDDAFDCVTFCETVLAAARSFTIADFQPQLRRIRYRDGEIAWPARNHYFADWALNNIANGICRAVALPDTTWVEKTVSYMHGLPVERVGLTSVPVASVLANAERLATGDIVGFLSRRPGIDYFHTGFLVTGKDGGQMLRHAAKSRGRVLDQKLEHFIAENGVRHVSLLRPQEVWTGEAIV